MASWGYASGAHGSVAPFVARSFGLDDAGMATLAAWLGVAALGALALGGAVDRFGRRRVLLFCAFVLPVGCGLSAISSDPFAYVVAQWLVHAAGGTLAATVAVMLAEALATGDRARGQGRAGLAFAAASALPLVAVAFLSGETDVWRVVWLLGVAPLLAWPWLLGRLPESGHWQEASRRGETQVTRLTDVFRGEHRERAALVLVAIVLIGGVDVATRAWLLYHPVRSLGIPPRHAVAVLVLGGAVGMLGFRLGARLSDRLGRRRTFTLSAIASVVGCLGYYGVSGWLVEGRVVCLAASLCLLAVSGNASTVAFRSVATELMPTRMRGSIGGWLAIGTALGWLSSMSLIAWWTPVLGSLGAAVALLAVIALPLACIALARLPETAGLELDIAARETLQRRV